MRALIVTNMYPSDAHPERGRFVADQVAALRRIAPPDVAIELFAFSADGSPAAYAGAARALRRTFGRGPGASRFDVVHAHFGLTLWPALAVAADLRVVTLHGTDLAHPRTRRLTVAGLRTQDLVATVSAELAGQIPAGALGRRTRRAVLPCGVALDRFAPRDRAEARRTLGLDPDAPCLLFPADPARPEKRIDRARAVAGDVRLLTLGGVAPDQVPWLVNAANAVLVPSDREGFGLAVLEALACDVPVLATPVGIHPEALAGVAGTVCAPFDAAAWRAALAPHLTAPDPRIAGRAAAARFSADRLAADVLAAWRGSRAAADRPPADA